MSKHIVDIASLTVNPSRPRNKPRLPQSDATIFHPWFVPWSTYMAIKRLVPRAYLMKMRDYYDKYGCMRCEKRDSVYGQNGMCTPCRVEVTRRLRRCVEARFRAMRLQLCNQELTEIVAGANEARKLLKDMVPPSRAIPRLRRQKYSSKNPTHNIMV
jgi:hypothetical protein